MAAGLASRLAGIYARSVYHPVSIVGRDAACAEPPPARRDARAGDEPAARSTGATCFPQSRSALREARKNAGDVSLAELAILATAAAARRRAARRSSRSAPSTGAPRSIWRSIRRRNIAVFTLDLPPDTAPKFALEAAERVLVEKPALRAAFPRRARAECGRARRAHHASCSGTRRLRLVAASRPGRPRLRGRIARL